MCDLTSQKSGPHLEERNGDAQFSSRRKRGRGRGREARTREKNGFWELGTRERLLDPHFSISAHRVLGNLIKLTVNATTNQKQARASLHD